MNLTQKHYEELKASCISDAIIERYFFSIEGDAAQRYLIEDAAGELSGHGQQYATAPVRKLLRTTNHVKAGAWGCTANGQLKPDEPRIKCECLNDGSWVTVSDDSQPDGLARIKYEIIREKPYKGVHVSVMHPVELLSTTCFVTEGSKKAASVVSLGLRAIGLPGVEMGLTAKDQDGNRELTPALKAMAGRGEAAVFGFDQDAKTSTCNNVTRAKSTLAAKYEAAGGEAFIVPAWPIEYGKGIDDVQASQGPAFVHQLIEKAIPFKQWQALRMAQQLRESNAHYYDLTCDRTIVNQRYIDYSLPKRGTILAPSSPMETGKTVAGGKLKDEFFQRHPDGLFELIGYRNALGQQTANKWGMDHISDLETSGGNVSQMLIDDASALAYCLDSLHRRIKAIRQAAAEGRPICVFLDEADAVLKHILGGGTMGKRQAELWGLFCEVLAIAGANGYVILAEANLSQLAVDAITEVSGGKVQAIENTYNPHAGRIAYDYSARSKEGKHADQLLARAFSAKVAALAEEGPVFVASDVQAEAERLEARLDAAGLSVLRIDGKTKERPETWALLQDPDGYIAEHRPDVVIATTTTESGVSISGGYFENVALYGAHLEDRALAQLSGRVRGDAPLHLFVKRRVRSQNDDPDSFSANGVLKEWHQNAFDSGAAADVRALFEAQILADAGERSKSKHAERFHRLKAHYQARSNISKFSLHYGLISILEANGLDIVRVSLTPSEFAEEEKATYEAARETVQEKEAKDYCEAPMDKSVSWAWRIQSSSSSKHSDRVAADKILLNSDYPGLALNDFEFVLDEIVQNRGGRIRAHTFSWLCKHPKIAKLIDLRSWKSQLEQQFIVMPCLKRESAKAQLLAQSALNEIAQLKTYEETTPIVISVAQWAKDRAQLLGRMFRLQIKDNQTNVAIVNKLLRKIGYKASSCSRPGSRDDRRQLWHAEAMPYQSEVWAALATKWNAELSAETIEIEQPQPRVTDLHREKAPIQIDDTPPDPPLKERAAVLCQGAIVPVQTSKSAQVPLTPDALDRWMRSREPVTA